jgi:hypothetical protein
VRPGPEPEEEGEEEEEEEGKERGETGEAGEATFRELSSSFRAAAVAGAVNVDSTVDVASSSVAAAASTFSWQKTSRFRYGGRSGDESMFVPELRCWKSRRSSFSSQVKRVMRPRPSLFEKKNSRERKKKRRQETISQPWSKSQTFHFSSLRA